MRFKVQAVERDGFKFYMRGGPVGASYSWPRGDQGYREIETVDTEDDGPVVEGEPLRVGRKTFAIISNDKQMRVVPSDSAVTTSDLVAKLAAAEARIGELEAELAASVAKLAAAEAGADDKPAKKAK